MNDFKKMADQTRRDFLKFLGKTGISLPLLQASTLGMGIMTSRFAQAAGKVSRVVFVYIPGGSPRGASATFTPSGSGAGMTMKICSQPLAPVKQNCIFFDGTAVMGQGGASGSHGLTQRVLGAFHGNGTTVDNLLAQSAIGSASRFGSLRLGVISNTIDGATLDTSISATNTWTASTYNSNPRTVFNTLFSGGGGGGGGQTTAQMQQAKIYDVNLAALQKIRTQLSVTERLRADENIAAIQKLQRDLAASTNTSSGCSSPAWNNFGTTDANPAEGAYFSQLFDQQARNAALAFSCNLTNVVSIQMGSDGAKFAPTGFNESYHDGAIHSGVEARYAAQRAYLSERVLSLINILKSTNDQVTGRPLFESTLILQVSDMGDANAHIGTDAPFMMASGASTFQGGKVMSVGQHINLLDTAANAMGLTGYTQYSSGPVAGVFS